MYGNPVDIYISYMVVYLLYPLSVIRLGVLRLQPYLYFTMAIKRTHAPAFFISFSMSREDILISCTCRYEQSIVLWETGTHVRLKLLGSARSEKL